MNAAFKWGWFGGMNTDCGCDSLYAAYFGTGLLLSYLVRAARAVQLAQATRSRLARRAQFLFIDFFIQTYKRGVAKRRQAKLDGGRKKTK
jgi:hypothetical protein